MSALDPLLDALRAAREATGERVTAIATVIAVGTSGITVRFDGETVASSRAYGRLADVATGERVVMLAVGSTWVAVASLTPRVLRSGVASLTFPANSRATGVILNFPVPFSAPPIVVVSTQDPRFVAGAYNITPTQCTIDSYFEGTTVGTSSYPLVVSWHAHGSA